MNKQMLLKGISENVKKKHPWKVSQEQYLKLFKELPREFLEERQYYDNLLDKCKNFKLCNLVLSQTKVEIKLTLDECIAWELSLDQWEDARSHNILPNDIKKILKEKEKSVCILE